MSNINKKKPLKSYHNTKLTTENKGNVAPLELCENLIRKGEFKLLNGDPTGLIYFDMALRLVPENAAFLLQKGIAVFEFSLLSKDLKHLHLACKYFKKSARLNPKNFEVYHFWGNALFAQGQKSKNPDLVLNAISKYKQALQSAPKHLPDQLFDLLWDQSIAKGYFADYSGEISDHHDSILAFKAAEKNIDYPPDRFYNDFGKKYHKMFLLTNCVNFAFKASECFKKAILTNKQNYTSWLNLGITFKKIYEYTHSEDFFVQSNDCHINALSLAKNPLGIYTSWAELLLFSGKTFKDISKLRSCIDVCEKAKIISKNNFKINILYINAMAISGSISDELSIITKAYDHSLTLIKKKKNPKSHLAYSICLSSLGSYYQDVDYYYQAIESLQEGLSIDRSCAALWHQMGLCSYQAALIDSEEVSFERAVHFFEQALGIGKTSILLNDFASCLLSYAKEFHSKELISQSVVYFDQAIKSLDNAIYTHPDWIFSSAVADDLYACLFEEKLEYLKALEKLSLIQSVHPEHKNLHHQFALTYSHYAETSDDLDVFYRAIHYYRIAYKNNKENDGLILDWAQTLLNLGDILENELESDQILREAELKMIQAAKLGNIHSFYSLACLYSVQGDLKNAIRFLYKSLKSDALPTVDELKQDDWLENIQESNDFKEFIKILDVDNKIKNDS